MRRLDPEQTPQELKPANVPTVLVFALGTAIWLVVFAVQGVRHLSGHSVDGRLALICLVGMALGPIGIAWGRVHARRSKEEMS